MSTEDFYTLLPALTKFLDLANPAHYVDAPDDWYVLITDIVGSTQAITHGQYKDVNLLGASSIIAVLNAIRPLEIPFVFGGDGASMLVPPTYLQPAREALLGVRQVARQAFGMELRVGIVPVVTVKAQHPLKVAKFRLTAQYSQASFLGGGISHATDLIKTNALYRLDIDDSSLQPDLRGLECRWQEVPSRYGQTISLIVAAMPSSQQSHPDIYRHVLEEIQRIYGDEEIYHPIAPSGLKLTFNPQHLRSEINARSPTPSLWGRANYLVKILLENVLGVILMGLRLKVADVNWGRYKEDLCRASDYQKMDDILRMVISGTPKQTEQLQQYLEQCWRSGHLVYGMHISDRALVTCLILDRRDRHFHLVDGADGGYALAAKAMKAQLHRKTQNWKSYTKLSRYRQP